MTESMVQNSTRGRLEAYAAAERGDIYGLITAVCYARIDDDLPRLTRYIQMSHDLPAPADPDRWRAWAMLQKRIRRHSAKLAVAPSK